MRNIKLTIQYDGSNYIGWQRQAPKHGLSIQQVLEDTLAELLRQPVTLNGAGRTDKGVHALGQVANFRCEKPIPAANLAKALNNLLPPDIMIREAVEVPEGFHARLTASGKRYRYLLALDRPDPFTKRYFWPLTAMPDLAKMQQAADLLLGEHDFRYYTLANATVKNFVRTITKLRFYVPPVEELPVYLAQPLALEAEANGFLYKMVRLLAARLLAVGQGLLEPEDLLRFLRGEVPGRVPPAPAQGLMLMQVYYPPQEM